MKRKGKILNEKKGRANCKALSGCAMRVRISSSFQVLVVRLPAGSVQFVGLAIRLIQVSGIRFQVPGAWLVE